MALIFVDAHVHLYKCFHLGWLFDAAYENMRAAAAQQKQREFTGVLCLAEVSGYHCFQQIKSASLNNDLGLGDWRRQQGAEAESVCLVNGHKQLILIAGRQIATQERLEVLALATRVEFTDGRSIHSSVCGVQQAGALTVLPWAVGKWLGKRQRLITECLADGIFLGDNGGRPKLWPAPAAFRLAGRSGCKILRGVDPLPIAGEERRVGEFGFFYQGEISKDAPAADLRHFLCQPNTAIMNYGRLESLARFVRNQVALRTRVRHSA